MIDVKSPLRRAYYQLLSGVLNFNGNILPVGDEAAPFLSTSNLFVIISTETDIDTSTFQSFDSKATINIEIVYKGVSRASRETVDNIANQVFSMVMPFIQTHGLPQQPGVQFLCVAKESDRDLQMQLNSSNTVLRRVITFSQLIRQTQNYSPVNAISKIIRVPAASFANATDYISSDLFGKQYEIFDNGVPNFLTFGIQWDYLSNLGQPGNGGFRILLPNFNSATSAFDFYIILK